MQQYLIINRLYSVVCLLSSVFCQLPSTSVENPLQINLFMQNKPKVKYAQINVSSFITSKYVKVDNWCNQKNKPNLVRRRRITKRVKLMQSVYLQRITEKRMISQSKKTNPIQTQSPHSLSSALCPLSSVLCPLPSVLCPLCVLCGQPFISFKNGLQNRKYRRYAVRQAESITCRQCPSQRYRPAGSNNNYYG
jgi:hypothetical protein